MSNPIRLFISLLFIIGNTQAFSQSDEFKFLGYKNSLPYFSHGEASESKLYAIRRNQFISSETAINNGRYLSINDNYHIFTQGSALVIQKNTENSSKKQFTIEGKIIDAVVNTEGTKVFFNLKEDESIYFLDVNSGNYEKTSLLGEQLQLIEDQLYYQQDPKNGSWFVHVYKSDVHDLSKTVRVAKSVFPHDMAISTDQKLIACYVPIKGRPVKAIFNIEKNRSYLLRGSDKINDAYAPVFNLHPEGFVFYSEDGKNIQFLQTPDSYDYNHTFE